METDSVNARPSRIVAIIIERDIAFLRIDH